MTERYIHTLSGAEEARKLAERYGDKVPKKPSMRLLHDCAKDYPPDMKKTFSKEYHIQTDDIMKKQMTTFIRATWVRKIAKRKSVRRYRISGGDKMAYHPAKMCWRKSFLLRGIVRVTKLLFEGLEKARELAYKNLDEAMEYILDSTIKYVKERNDCFILIRKKLMKHYYKNLKK